ncbi:hypothetical protein L1887_59127 [Cichorium endivia]|nr:hypothetical protein L1887_59127 [Cichorium endivia]
MSAFAMRAMSDQASAAGVERVPDYSPLSPRTTASPRRQAAIEHCEARWAAYLTPSARTCYRPACVRTAAGMPMPGDTVDGGRWTVDGGRWLCTARWFASASDGGTLCALPAAVSAIHAARSSSTRIPTHETETNRRHVILGRLCDAFSLASEAGMRLRTPANQGSKASTIGLAGGLAGCRDGRARCCAAATLVRAGARTGRIRRCRGGWHAEGVRCDTWLPAHCAGMPFRPGPTLQVAVDVT